jgi:nucleolar protein 53
VSKNRKKTWRKHTDIKDVEDRLEDERLAERTGEIPGQLKFVVEKKGDRSVVVEDSEENGLKSELLNKKKKPRTTQDIVSKIFAYKSLENKSKVNAVKTSRIGPKSEPKALKVTKAFASKWEVKEVQRKRAIAQNEAFKSEVKDPSLRNKYYDLWDEDKGEQKKGGHGKDEEEEEEDEDLNQLEADQVKLIGRHPKKIPVRRFQKPSLLPSVELPHPGTSYNPSFEDHQDLLMRAALIEQKKLKEEQHLKRVVDKYYLTADDTPSEEVYMKEMSQGLGLEGDDDDEEEDGDEDGDQNGDDEGIDEEGALISNPVIRAQNRKSKAQKRKEKLLKMMMDKKKLEREDKRRVASVFSIKKLKKEIREAEDTSKEKQKKREAKKIAKLYAPHRLSVHKFQEQDMPLQLSSELSSSLRGLRAEGDLLQERFKSFQKRNLIEPRVVNLKKRKAKTRSFEKRDSSSKVTSSSYSSRR